MQRALWDGAISFGLVHIPVNLYSAEVRKELDLSMLDRSDFAPIGYRKYNKNTGKEVEKDQIVKGYEYASGEYVVLSDEDLRKANVKATQTIDILAFVDSTEVPLTFYDQPYYLAPGKGGDKVYALLRETLRRSGKIGIAQIVLRTKQHLAALLPVGEVIVLNTLRYLDEIRDIDDYKLPDTDVKSMGISEKEMAMALSLVEGMSETWQPEQYHDVYRDDVLALIEAKVKAHQTKTITLPAKGDQAEPVGGAKILDLMALLKQSIASKGGDGGVGSTGSNVPATKKKSAVKTLANVPAKAAAKAVATKAKSIAPSRKRA